MDRPLKTPPPYVVTSVDNALRVATMLQLEGSLTVSEIARRLAVAPSTAHRLLATLVYRDFATLNADRSYRVGPVLELAAHSHSATSMLRAAALPHLARLVEILDESANVVVRTGTTVRFIASVECSRALRVGNREGMVFPAEQTSGGLLLLAGLEPDEFEALYGDGRDDDGPDPHPWMRSLRQDLARARRNGFTVNNGRSERGVVAVGVPVHDQGGRVIAGLSVSIPSVRYEKHRLPAIVNTLRMTASALEADLD